jgi:hypothetical protein
MAKLIERLDNKPKDIQESASKLSDKIIDICDSMGVDVSVSADVDDEGNFTFDIQPQIGTDSYQMKKIADTISNENLGGKVYAAVRYSKVHITIVQE